ncbi:MAG: 3'-5' exonuclease [Candidatus Aminicenantes bacterium]|nr:3'-5' exonuclease [Candidatus Aminicenantes bacterium]
MREDDHEKAVAWARGLLEQTDWVILDTETTGTSPYDEIVQIAIVAWDGKVLLDTLVRPTQPIPLSATAIHGISDTDVLKAPSFPEVYGRVQRILFGKRIVVYNAQFDLRLIRQTLSRHNLLPYGLDRDQAECAMLAYSAWVGEQWPDGGYKWQKLVSGDHTAVGDCLATLALIKRMAEG